MRNGSRLDFDVILRICGKHVYGQAIRTCASDSLYSVVASGMLLSRQYFNITEKIETNFIKFTWNLVVKKIVDMELYDERANLLKEIPNF